MEFLLSPQAGLAGLTLASFIASTLVPLSSEAVLFGYLKLHPEHAALAVALATLGNTAGGMTTYWLGRLIPRTPPDTRALGWLRRYGVAATLFAWLPLVGDAIAAAAGWLRMHWLAVLLLMGAGRLARYLVVAQGAYWL